MNIKKDDKVIVLSAKAKGCSMTGPEDPDILRLNVLA